MRRRFSAAAAALAVAAAFSSCQKSPEPVRLDPIMVAAEAEKAHAEAAANRQKQLAAKGRAIYQTVCIACHNTDPKKPGAIGPEVWGSSEELLRVRILNGGYPPGYKPKRGTHTMQPLPQVAHDIPAIHAYLNTP